MCCFIATSVEKNARQVAKFNHLKTRRKRISGDFYRSSDLFFTGQETLASRLHRCELMSSIPLLLGTDMKLSIQRTQQQNRTGAMLPMVAVVIVILFVACAFAADIARMHLTRSELRTATDAAARAGVETLARAEDTNLATEAALAIARENIVAGVGLNLNPDQIVFGNSVRGEDGRFQFTESSDVINSVRVVGERTADSPDGPVSLLFGPLLGTDTFSPTMASTAVRVDRDIAIVLDKSGSMGREGRFEGLQNGLDVFLTAMEESIPEEHVSLTVYDTFPQKLVDMTADTIALREAFATQSPDGFTGIGRALEVGLDSILNDAGSRGPFTLKSVVLMTDGRQNRGINPIAVSQRAKRLGITVHTLTFSEGANQDLMIRVAENTGGIHVHADTNEQLADAFDRIARTIQVLTIE